MGFDRNARLIALIALVALIARLCVVAADNDYTPAHDAFDYDRHATSIAAGDGFPPSGYEVGGGPSALRAPPTRTRSVPPTPSSVSRPTAAASSTSRSGCSPCCS